METRTARPARRFINIVVVVVVVVVVIIISLLRSLFTDYERDNVQQRLFERNNMALNIADQTAVLVFVCILAMFVMALDSRCVM